MPPIIVTLPDLLILALATLYWSHAISQTHGAFGIFQTLRRVLPMGGLMTCPVCLSVWLALALWLLTFTPLYPLVTISAVAGAATLAGFYTGMWQSNH